MYLLRLHSHGFIIVLWIHKYYFQLNLLSCCYQNPPLGCAVESCFWVKPLNWSEHDCLPDYSGAQPPGKPSAGWRSAALSTLKESQLQVCLHRCLQSQETPSEWDLRQIIIQCCSKQQVKVNELLQWWIWRGTSVGFFIWTRSSLSSPASFMEKNLRACRSNRSQGVEVSNV